jgi:CheY-specific phosphatase CheX
MPPRRCWRIVAVTAHVNNIAINAIIMHSHRTLALLGVGGCVRCWCSITGELALQWVSRMIGGAGVRGNYKATVL